MTYSLKSPLSFSSAPAKPGARAVNWPLLGMIAATAGWAAVSILGMVGAIMSPMVFDARGSTLNPLAWLAFLLTISFWAVCLLGPYLSWVLRTRGQVERAWALMATPLAYGMLTLAVLQFLPAK